MDILPTRATLLASRIGHLQGWGLLVICPCRGFPRHVAVDRLTAEYGVRPTLETILGRLRCTYCKRPPSRVEAKQGDPFAKRAPAVVLLESRGAVDRNRG